MVYFTWLACGATTKITGPSVGTLCAPLGLTSRKKISNIKLNNQSAISQVNLCNGDCFTAGIFNYIKREEKVWGKKEERIRKEDFIKKANTRKKK